MTHLNPVRSTSCFTDHAGQRNLCLEFFRAAAAVMVFLHHLLGLPEVRHLMGKSVFLFVYGHEAVIGFFLLSGYVNRLSIDRQLPTTANFLSRRFWRLLPQYWITVLFCFVVESLQKQSFDLTTLLGHFFFVATNHGEIVRGMSTNPALWSMSFEMWFYVLLSVAIVRRSVMLPIWLAASATCCAVSLFWVPEGAPLFFFRVFGYSLVWLVGYFIPQIRSRIRFSPPCVVVLIFCIPIITNLGIDRMSPFWFAAISLFLVPVLIETASTGTDAATTLDHFRGLCLTIFLSVCACCWIISTRQAVSRTSLLLLLPVGALIGWRQIRHLVVGIMENHPNVILLVGRASFAIYLTHMAVISVGRSFGLTSVPLILWSVLGTVVSVFLLEWVVQPRIMTLAQVKSK